MRSFSTLLELCLVAAGVGVALLATVPRWGPGMHIELTLELLRRFRRRKSCSPLQAVVLEHPEPFLYGNIAADIINFKAYGGMKNHCHNWNIQERLESHAEGGAAQAFILGYLCHLAADVVAHNYFVPFHLVYDFPPRWKAHAYWEALADGLVSDGEWHAIDGLKRMKSLHEFDLLVHRAVRRRALSLRPNRWIFNNVLLLSCRKRWRALVRTVHENARKHPLDSSFFRRARAESFRNMLSVFQPERLALLKSRDPTGRSALQGARRLRREILRDFGRGAHAREVARELAREAYRIVR